MASSAISPAGALRPAKSFRVKPIIAETYRVNRHTVRRALASLAERGLVRAERGSGTYVDAPKLTYPLRARTRFSDIVGAGGREPGGQLIGSCIEPAPRELAKQLKLKTGAPLLRLDVLRFADRAPICVATTWLSAVRFADAAPIYERMHSMTRVLAYYNIKDYRRHSTRVTAAIIDAGDATRLDLALGRPVLIVESTDVDAGRRAVADIALAVRRRAGRVHGGEQQLRPECRSQL